MAKSRKDIYDSAKSKSEAYSERVDNFKTPFTYQDVIGDVTTGKFTEGALNSSRHELNKKQYNYFKSFDRYNFKYGIEVRPGENGGEDPVVFGFDIVINTHTSPLFGKNNGDNITDFFTFAYDNKITEITNRTGVWVEFVKHFSKFFKRTDSDFKNFKSFYLKGISGLDNLINKTMAVSGTNAKKQFISYGDDKESISLTMLEDVQLSSGHLAMLYNTLAYSKINGKQLIPENLLRFDMSIIVSEIRKFNKVKKALSDGTDVMNIVNDNISRYKYNLYDCQFNFENMTHGNEIKNDGTEATKEYSFKVYYKFATLEMEKFNLKIGEDDVKTYLNSGSVNPVSGLNGDLSNTPSLTDLPYRTDKHDYIRFDKTQEPGNNVNKFITPTPQIEKITDEDTDVRSDIDKMKEDDVNKLGGNLKNPTDVSEIDKLKNEEKLVNGPFGEVSNVTQGFGEKLKGGVASIIKNTAQFALIKARNIRNKLINDTLQKIRTNTGLRRINSPVNVYQNPSVLNFLKDQIRDFANDTITDLIQKSPLGNLPVNDINVLNEEYNTRIHGGEGSVGGISSFDNEDTLL